MARSSGAEGSAFAWDDEALEAVLRESLTLLNPEPEFRERLRLRLLDAELVQPASFPWQETLPRGVLMAAVAVAVAVAALYWWRSRRVLLASEAGGGSGF